MHLWMLVHLYTRAGGCLSESLQVRPGVVGTQHWSNCSKTSSDSAVQIPQSSQGIVGWGWLAGIYCHNMHLASSPASFSMLHTSKYVPLKAGIGLGTRLIYMHTSVSYTGCGTCPGIFSKSDPPTLKFCYVLCISFPPQWYQVLRLLILIIIILYETLHAINPSLPPLLLLDLVQFMINYRSLPQSSSRIWNLMRRRLSQQGRQRQKLQPGQ